MNTVTRPPSATAYELRFASLFDAGRGFSFPCDAHGGIELAALSERARRSLQAALAAVGRDLSTPCVLPAARH